MTYFGWEALKMKKVIIEQIGNIIMVILATWTMSYMVANSYWHANGESSFRFGIYGILFLAWLIIFGIVRAILGRVDPSFNSSQGELSAGDEREKAISQQALRWIYHVMITLLLIELIAIPVLSLGMGAQPVLFAQAVVIALGGALIISFIVYLSGWLYFDAKE
ncbi:hypothetical protein FD12_GL002567 [Lentilactobacillus rapi DSM 19907 = JCM 15042]|nr:hypothetical protein FD12_GL002567 [Lentilactobacillus rapi DSM 19907 = JCM 15042]